MKRIWLMIVGSLVLAYVAQGQVFYCPNDVDSIFPIILVDSTDGVTRVGEKKFDDTTITVTDVTDGNTPASYTDNATTWTEIGNNTGAYRLVMGATHFDEPDSVYYIEVSVVGCLLRSFWVYTPETVANRFNDIAGTSEATVEDAVVAGLIAHGLTAAAAAKLTEVYVTDAASYLDDANNTFRSTEAFMTSAFQANWNTVADVNTILDEYLGDMPAAGTTITAQITEANDTTNAAIAALTFTGDVTSLGGSSAALDNLKTAALAGFSTAASFVAQNWQDPNATALIADANEVNDTAALIYARLGEPAGTSIADDISNLSVSAFLDELLAGHLTPGTVGAAIDTAARKR